MEYSFKYSLTEDDYADYNAYTEWYAPWMKKQRISYVSRTLLYTGLSFTAVYIIVDKINSPGFKHPFPMAIVTGVILIIVMLINYHQAPYGIKKRAREMIRKEENQHILSETELTVNDNGITTLDIHGTTQQKWSSIVRCAVTKDSFYLYLNTSSAYIIPKRLFRTQQEIADFDKFLTEKIPLSSSFRSLGV